MHVEGVARVAAENAPDAKAPGSALKSTYALVLHLKLLLLLLHLLPFF